MTELELRNKLKQFCKENNIEKPELFEEYTAKFITLIKNHYGNFNIREDLFDKDDTLYAKNHLNTKNNDGYYELDEYLFNRTIRNISAFYDTSSKEGKLIY